MLEEDGLATTQISLIRIHTERIQPPRALWVPFELGRPFGVPSDPDFQKQVLAATFALFGSEHGPVLVDYPEDVPDSVSKPEPDATGMVCPIDLPTLPDPDAPKSEIGQALMKEANSLAPWYDLAVRNRARTTVGASGLSPDAAARYLAAFLEDQATPAPRDDIPAGRVLKLVYEDLKAYYTEAITAQPGSATSKQVEDWLFKETVLGKALWTLRDVCRSSNDEYHRYLGRNSIVPDRQINPST